MSQKKKYSLLLVLIFFVAFIAMRFPCGSTALAVITNPDRKGGAKARHFSNTFSLTKLPIRSLQSLLPPHGMKPLIPEPPITLLDRPLRPWVRTKIQTDTVSPPKTHLVQTGETLSKIARQYYGSPKHWQKIYRANQHLLTNPNTLRTGMILVIP